MRIRERICPKRCVVPCCTTVRQRMLIEVVEEKAANNRVDLVLNWYCPVCGHNEPMNTKDLRVISRLSKSFSGGFIQKKYYPETKRLEKHEHNTKTVC